MLAGIIAFVLKLASSGLLDKTLELLKATSDNATERDRIDATVAIEHIKAELGRRQAERWCQSGQCGADQHRLVGRDPPDDVVLRPVPVGVFDGDLGLADTAEAVQGMRHDDGDVAAEQLGVQAVEQFLPAGEVLVTGWNLAPHRGNASRAWAQR